MRDLLDELVHKEEADLMGMAFMRLPPRFQSVMWLRFGLDGHGERTLADTARAMGWLTCTGQPKGGLVCHTQKRATYHMRRLLKCATTS